MKDIYMSDVSEQIRGVSYKPHDVLSDPCDNAIGLLRANNICDGNININDLVYVRKECVSDKQLLRKGDILLCASSGSKNLVGKAAQIEKDSKYGFGAFCKVVRPKHIDPLYLGMFFQSNLYRQYISQASQGANINNIRNEDIATIRLKYHTEQEQKEIAKKLFNVRNIISKNKEVLNNLDNLTKSRFVEMFGDPIVNTKRLPEQKFEELCFLKAGNTTSAEDIHNVGDKYPYPCYGGNGIRGYVDTFSYEGMYPIIGRQGALCGNVQLTMGKFYATEHAVIVKPITEINVLWFYYLLKYLNLNRYHTGAAQPGLAVKNLNLINIPVARLCDQNKYAIFVQQTDKLKLFPR
jgi:type I restriction enzyme S subunit